MNAGWGWPGNSRKAHWFPADEMISLCRKWMFTGPREDTNEASADDCAACTRALAKIRVRGEGLSDA